MELVFQPSRRAVDSALAKTSVGPGLFLQRSVCVHLCLISSALSVPARSLQKSLGLVIPLPATLHNICHDTAFRDPATSARALAFCLLPHAHAFSLLSLLLSFSPSENSARLFDQTALMSYPAIDPQIIYGKEFCSWLESWNDLNAVVWNEKFGALGQHTYTRTVGSVSHTENGIWK